MENVSTNEEKPLSTRDLPIWSAEVLSVDKLRIHWLLKIDLAVE